MSPESTSTALLQPILHALTMSLNGLEESVCLYNDGTLVAYDEIVSPGHQGLPGLTEFVNLAQRICHTLAYRDTQEAMIRGRKRFIAFYRVNEHYILGVIGRSTIHTGLLSMACRRTVAQLQNAVTTTQATIEPVAE